MKINNDPGDHGEFTQQEVEAVIKNLKKDVSPGPDNLTTEFIQILHQKTKTFFVNLFNSCLKIGYFPKDWKVSKIILFPKKKNQSTPSDYRPIAINSIFEKILEKLLKDRLYYFLNKRELFLKKSIWIQTWDFDDPGIGEHKEKIGSSASGQRGSTDNIYGYQNRIQYYR